MNGKKSLMSLAYKIRPSQNTNVYYMVVQCSHMFANIKHIIPVFNENLLDVCEDSSKCEKRLCLAMDLLEKQ